MGASVRICLAPVGADPRAEARRLLLSLAGTLVDDPELTHEESGRPHIPGLAVSISYTARTVAVAASYDGPLGIDLEELVPRDAAPLADRWFTQQELRWMDHQPDRLTAFLHLWTAKEAVGKARGLGLTDAVLHHPMPLPPALQHEPELYGDVVPGEGPLVVLHMVADEPPEGGAVSGRGAGGRQVILAVAAAAGVSEIVVHRAGAGGSGTRIPVVVRGN